MHLLVCYLNKLQNALWKDKDNYFWCSALQLTAKMTVNIPEKPSFWFVHFYVEFHIESCLCYVHHAAQVMVFHRFGTFALIGPVWLISPILCPNNWLNDPNCTYPAWSVVSRQPITKLHVTQVCKIIISVYNMYSALFQVQYGNSKQRLPTKF